MLDIKDMLVDLIEQDTPVNVIARAFDYNMNQAQSDLLLQLLKENSKEIYTNDNDDTYRVVYLPHEVRFEFLSGKPFTDMPWSGLEDVGVNTVDFLFDRTKKNFLCSYHERVGSIRYRFNWEKTLDLSDNLRVLKYYLVPDKELIVTRFDRKPGYTVCSENGYELVTGESSDLDFNYAVVGIWGRRLILNYAYL